MKKLFTQLALLAIATTSLSLTACISVKRDDPAVTTSRTTTVTPTGVSQTTTVAE